MRVFIIFIREGEARGLICKMKLQYAKAAHKGIMHVPVLFPLRRFQLRISVRRLSIWPAMDSFPWKSVIMGAKASYAQINFLRTPYNWIS